MRKFYTFALLSLLAVPFVACSSSDDGGTAVVAKGGSGGKGGSGTGGKAGGSTGGTAGSETGGSGGATGGSDTGGSGGATGGSGGATGGSDTGGSGGATGGSGGATGGTGGGGGGTCDPQTAPDSAACEACMGQNGKGATSCTAQATACQNSTECQTVLECIQPCTDNACFTQCFQANVTGAQVFLSYYGCIQAACHDECSCPGCSLTTGNDTCDGCFQVKCLTECNGCDMQAACMGALMCTSNVCNDGDTACMQACYDANPGAEAQMGALGTCLDGQCGTECAK